MANKNENYSSGQRNVQIQPIRKKEVQRLGKENLQKKRRGYTAKPISRVCSTKIKDSETLQETSTATKVQPTQTKIQSKRRQQKPTNSPKNSATI